MSMSQSDSASDLPSRANALQYARRDAAADARRYSLFEPAALVEHQHRLRAMVEIWRSAAWTTLAGRDMVEVGCGTGGNLVDLLRLGAEPMRLTGIELLPDRVSVARALLPSSVRMVEGDATSVDLPAASQDAVLAFTVFSSILDDTQQERLARAMWSWVRPGGGVMCYDFAIDNPGNRDVRAFALRRARALFPEARSVAVRRLTLAPPLARALGRVHPGMIAPVAMLMPFLRTHRLVWLVKP